MKLNNLELTSCQASLLSDAIKEKIDSVTKNKVDSDRLQIKRAILSDLWILWAEAEQIGAALRKSQKPKKYKHNRSHCSIA